jgi:hypothetical protein
VAGAYVARWTGEARREEGVRVRVEAGGETGRGDVDHNDLGQVEAGTVGGAVKGGY